MQALAAPLFSAFVTAAVPAAGTAFGAAAGKAVVEQTVKAFSGGSDKPQSAEQVIRQAEKAGINMSDLAEAALRRTQTAQYSNQGQGNYAPQFDATQGLYGNY